MAVLQIDHETVYNYSLPVAASRHLAHLLPRECGGHRWLSHTLEISPAPVFREERLDVFGNRALLFSLEEEHTVFRIKASGVAEVRRAEPPKDSVPWEEAAARAARPAEPGDWEACAFAFPSPMVSFNSAVRRYAEESFTPRRPLAEAAADLTGRIYREFKYAPASTKIGAMPAEILRERHGVCQDFAHFMAACMRSLGLPCCYVSGYLLTKAPPGQAKLVGADATHAWVSVYLPGFGWADLDPTNNLIVGDEHITVARGRDFSDVSPLKGVIMGGGPHTVKVAVNVGPPQI
jgi:transglutaminase-like putative cysteine protease